MKILFLFLVKIKIPSTVQNQRDKNKIKELNYLPKNRCLTVSIMMYEVKTS
jgi:hypothetical protein